MSKKKEAFLEPPTTRAEKQKLFGLRHPELVDRRWFWYRGKPREAYRVIQIVDSGVDAKHREAWLEYPRGSLRIVPAAEVYADRGQCLTSSDQWIRGYVHRHGHIFEVIHQKGRTKLLTSSGRETAWYGDVVTSRAQAVVEAKEYLRKEVERDTKDLKKSKVALAKLSVEASRLRKALERDLAARD